MKLTAIVKLLTNTESSAALLSTMEMANRACNRLSYLAWEAKCLKQFDMHRAFYKQLREEFPLSSQVVIRLNAKVADAYKIQRGAQRVFRAHGSIAYDARILSWNISKSAVSIWTVKGRLTIPFVCGETQRELLENERGESGLVFQDGKWFLFVYVDVPDTKEQLVSNWLGCDMGVVNILTDSDGVNYSGAHLNGLRHRYSKLRSKLQSKGTKSAKRLLTKRRHKESRFSKDLNHQISKQIVEKAKDTERGIALEDLTHIRERITARKPQRRQLHSWAFADLRSKITYKAKRLGVPVCLVDPRNTSRKCPSCEHTEKANRRTRDRFECKACGFSGPADHIGAKNISLAAINQPNVGTTCKHVRDSSGKPKLSGYGS